MKTTLHICGNMPMNSVFVLHKRGEWYLELVKRISKGRLQPQKIFAVTHIVFCPYCGWKLDVNKLTDNSKEGE